MASIETYRHAAEEYVSYATYIGYACHLAARTRSYARAPLAVFPLWIEPAVWLSQIQFLFDRRGQPVSYFTYAFLTEAVEHRLLHDPRVILHISEWKEGDRIWVLDMVAMPGYLRSTLSLAASVFPDADRICYLRRLPDGQIKKTVRLARTANGFRLNR
ncbi:toxin-activating lysine-acyltransferase [Luteimonas galliterrae]|uniref:toxin-activating lysine-acyltransferase n=1 Tax=Luteimonas galliterrae TaxID=2940486 RepID=UPI003CE518D2